MQFHIADAATIANFLVLLGIYGKVKVMTYQHKLMWTDFARRKGIDPTAPGKDVVAGS